MSCELDTLILEEAVLGGEPPAPPPPPPPELVEDPRYRTKLFLETYLSNANLTDDDENEIDYAVMYAYPNYSIVKEFKAASNPVDLLFLIEKPTSRPLAVHARFEEMVPITICCIDKTSITGTNLNWKAERELRRIFKVYPWGSLRSIDRIGDNDERLGSTILHKTRLMLNYRRTVTW